MSLPSIDGDILTGGWLLGKVSVLLAVAGMTHALVDRRASAATRHLVWTFTVVGLLFLPMLSAVLPGWIVVRLTAATPLPTWADAGVSPSAVVAATQSAQNGHMAFDIPWSTVLPACYAAGVLFLLARLIAEQVTLQRIARHATEMNEPTLTGLLVECAQRLGVRRPVRVLRSREHSMPMVFGTRVPTIVLPAVADTWSQDRRRAVLLHELAHVARYDCLTQMAAAVACAVYWIHPGVWWVARRLRLDRELACDDRVLAAGTHAREYAGHLLELAFSLGGHRARALAMSVARPHQLEGRMLAVLDTARNRATPTLRSRLAGSAIMVALLVSLAGAEAAVVPAGANSPTVVDLKSAADEGPMILIESIEFVGNEAVSSGTLKRQMKWNTQRSIWTRMLGGQSPYQEARFDQDAERIVADYRDHGFITARVGAPELKVVRDSADKKTRLVDLRIPVVEGHRYKVGAFTFAGNTVIKNEALRLMFKVEGGAYYKQARLLQADRRPQECRCLENAGCRQQGRRDVEGGGSVVDTRSRWGIHRHSVDHLVNGLGGNTVRLRWRCPVGSVGFQRPVATDETSASRGFMQNPQTFRKMFLLIAGTLAIGALNQLEAQSPDPKLPTFDVASVKPNKSGDWRISMTGVGCVAPS